MPKFFDLIYLMMPAYLANMTPPFVKYWKGWNRPMNQRWLGDHKTVVGFLSGVVVAVAVTFAQSRIHWHGGLLPYTQWPLLGLAFGVGAMGGDTMKSLLKRKLGIPPGHSWIPMDQLDFVIGALVLVSPWLHFGWLDLASILIISFVGDIAINHLSYWFGIRDTQW